MLSILQSHLHHEHVVLGGATVAEAAVGNRQLLAIQRDGLLRHLAQALRFEHVVVGADDLQLLVERRGPQPCPFAAVTRLGSRQEVADLARQIERQGDCAVRRAGIGVAKFHHGRRHAQNGKLTFADCGSLYHV